MKYPLLLGFELSTLVVCLAVALHGVGKIIGSFGGDSMGNPSVMHYLIPVVLGTFFSVEILRDRHYIFGPTPPPGTWTLKHIEAMLGVGIAFYTAFAVFGFRYLVPFFSEPTVFSIGTGR